MFTLNNGQQEIVQAVINTTNILAKGYGKVPKVLMQDERLSGTAKLIYSYLSTYAKWSDEFEEESIKAFPNVETICKDLQIHRKTFDKHKKSLVDTGYITIQKRKQNSNYVHNVYLFNLDIPMVKKEPMVKGENVNEKAFENETIGTFFPEEENHRQNFSQTIGNNFPKPGAKKVPINKNIEHNNNNNNTTTTSNTQKAQKIFTLVQTELRTFSMSPMQQGVVMDWLDTFEVDVIEEAIKRAVMNGHAYIKGADNILNKWRSVGAFTMDGVRKDDELFQQRKQQRGNNGWNNQQSNQPVAKKKYKDGDIMPGGRVYRSIYDF